MKTTRKKSLLVPLFGLMLGLAVLPAQAATLPVGTNQTYTTVADALAAAVDGDTIEIQAGIYAEVCPLTVFEPNLTIKSAPGADVTIQHGPGSAAASKVLVVSAAATGFKLQGSAGHLLTIHSTEGGSPVTLDLVGATNQCDYVKVSGVGGAAAHLYINGPATLNNCTIDPSGGNSIIANGGNTSDLTFNDCTLKTGGGLTVYGVGLVAPGKLIFNRCNFVAPSGHPYAAIACNNFSAGGGEVIATDCNFQNYGTPIHGSSPGAQPNMKMTLINPSRSGAASGMLGYLNNGLNLTVQGKSATNKTVMPNGGGRNIFQGTGPATLTLTDLVLNDAIETQDGNIDNPITWNINRCILKNSPTSPSGASMLHIGADVNIPGWGGTGSLTVNATNTVFAANGGSVAMLMFGKMTTDSLNFFHCTFYNAGNPVNALMTGGAGDGDVITARYCIFKAAGFTTYNSTNSLNGLLNIVQGPVTFAGGIPGDSLNVDPLINASGRLLDGSPATNAAAGSVLNIDVDGTPRPQEGVNDIGADELKPGAPIFVTMPQNTTNSLGSNIVFTVVVTGTPTPSLQWFKNGFLLPGETGSTLTLNNVGPADVASYHATASNSVDIVTSESALAVIDYAPTIVSASRSLLELNQVVVVFNKTVQASGATNILSYALNNGSTVTAASINGGLTTVTLTLGNSINDSVTHTLTVNGVRSTFGTLITNNTQVTVYVPNDTVRAQYNLGGTNDLVVLEAEHYNGKYANVPGTHQWVFTTSPALLSPSDVDTNYSGTGVMESTPNTGINAGTPAFGDPAPNASCRLDFKVQFYTPGTYYIFPRGVGDGSPGPGASDSVLIGFNGGLAAGKTLFPQGQGYTWGISGAGNNGPIVVSTPGLHTINVWMREDGFALDRILLTSDELYEPTGIGPAESPIVPKLSISHVGGQVVLTWPGGGILQSSTNVVGTYVDIPGSVSPWTNTATGNQKYYRVRQ